MGLERIINLKRNARKFLLASLIGTCLTFNCLQEQPIYSQINTPPKKVEDYFQQKISMLEQTNPQESEQTKNLIDNIAYEKKKFDANFARQILNAEFYQKQKQEKKWDLTEKTLGLAFIALNALDAYQSCEVIGKEEQRDGKTIRYIEKNSYSISNLVLGDNPSDKNTILFRTASTAAYLAACHFIPKYFYNPHAIRKLMLGVGTSYEASFVINNEGTVEGGILFKKSF